MAQPAFCQQHSFTSGNRRDLGRIYCIQVIIAQKATIACMAGIAPDNTELIVFTIPRDKAYPHLDNALAFIHALHEAKNPVNIFRRDNSTPRPRQQITCSKDRFLQIGLLPESICIGDGCYKRPKDHRQNKNRLGADSPLLVRSESMYRA